MGTSIILANWSYQDFMSFNVAYQSGKARLAFELASKVVTAWDYPVDLNQENPILELNPIESAHVLRRVIEAVEQFTEGVNVEDVEVDLTKMTTGKFLDFNDAQVSHDFKKVERMMHEFAYMEGIDPNEPLTAVQGMTMQYAITFYYRKVIEGKN